MNRRFLQQDETFSLSQASHAILRRATCQHLRKHFAEICLSEDIPIIDTIKKLENSDKALSDEDIVGRYCDHYEKLGVWVENPVVVAFAHFCQLSLTIFHVSHAGLYPVSHPQPIHRLTQGSGLFCNEWHYQASIYIQKRRMHNRYIYPTSRTSQATVSANEVFKLGDKISHFVQSKSLQL